MSAGMLGLQVPVLSGYALGFHLDILLKRKGSRLFVQAFCISGVKRSPAGGGEREGTAGELGWNRDRRGEQGLRRDLRDSRPELGWLLRLSLGSCLVL